VANRLRYPVFGLTEVLDHPEVPLPPEIDRTVAGIDAAEIGRAADVAAELLWNVSRHAASLFNASLPDELADCVTRQLRPEHDGGAS
jgi:hypothetical protein